MLFCKNKAHRALNSGLLTTQMLMSDSADENNSSDASLYLERIALAAGFQLSWHEVVKPCRTPSDLIACASRVFPRYAGGRISLTWESQLPFSFAPASPKILVYLQQGNCQLPHFRFHFLKIISDVQNTGFTLETREAFSSPVSATLTNACH